MGQQDNEADRELAPSDRSEEQGIPQFVTNLSSIELQIGEHVITSLRHPGTVAVISAVMPGGETNQRIVSVPLSQELFGQVQRLLAEAQAAKGPPEREVPCLGFHCVLESRGREAKKDKSQEA